MPKPKPGEDKDGFMSRCVPYVIREGKDREQAAAICSSMWSGRRGRSPAKLFKAARKSKVPPGGWTDATFRGTAAGRQLIEDIGTVRRLALRQNVKRFREVIRDHLTRHYGDIVKRYLELERLHYGHSATAVAGTKAANPFVTLSLDLDFPVHADLWAEAINDVLYDWPYDFDAQLTVEVTPVYQSTMDHVYRKTSVLLGAQPSTSMLEMLTQSAQGLAKKVTQINKTTVKAMQVMFQKAFESGATVAETIRGFVDKFPSIRASRMTTIVRNEMGIAADTAAKQSMKDSGVVTHVSVVGCMAIEPGIPTYNGIPTCNIQNVPIGDIDLLRFHINHTGTIIPSAFVNPDGTVPERTTTEGIPDGDPDE